jgi:hypothetical protein
MKWVAVSVREIDACVTPAAARSLTSDLCDWLLREPDVGVREMVASDAVIYLLESGEARREAAAVADGWIREAFGVTHASISLTLTATHFIRQRASDALPHRQQMETRAARRVALARALQRSRHGHRAARRHTQRPPPHSASPTTHLAPPDSLLGL